MFDVCFPDSSNVGGFTEQTLKPPQNTFQFVFAALLLNSGEPIKSRGCHNEGGDSVFSTPTPSVCTCVSVVVVGMNKSSLNCVLSLSLCLSVKIKANHIK